MPIVHRTLDGDWSDCDDNACDLKFHFSDISSQEAASMPLVALLPIFEAFDPPTPHTYPESHKIWTIPSDKARGEMLMHREYDLPAVIRPDGTLEWWYRDRLHRDDGKPARIWPSGAVDYYVYGQLVTAK